MPTINLSYRLVKLGKKNPVSPLIRVLAGCQPYFYLQLSRRWLIRIASCQQRLVISALYLAVMHAVCHLLAINYPCKYGTGPHAILPGCLSIGWTINLPSLAIARQFAGQKMRLLAHLKLGHARQSFSKLAGPCCKGWDRPHGPKSSITN